MVHGPLGLGIIDTERVPIVNFQAAMDFFISERISAVSGATAEMVNEGVRTLASRALGRQIQSPQNLIKQLRERR